MRELLHTYRNPPPEPKPVQFAGAEPSNSNVYISNMLGQLQATIQSMSSNRESPSLAGTGLQLNINADILRWMVVLAFVIVIVVMLFQFMSRRKAKNPLKKRLKKLENELRALRSRKNPAALETSEADED
jgi:hypothetical protein